MTFYRSQCRQKIHVADPIGGTYGFVFIVVVRVLYLSTDLVISRQPIFERQLTDIYS